MLVYVTGIAGSGKSTLRSELQRRGYRAIDADEDLCAWFDAAGNQVPTLPLNLRAAAWYRDHTFRLIEERVAAFADVGEGGIGFVLGVAANADDMTPYFQDRFFLTADTEIVLERLRTRDGAAHATRFAGFDSAKEWQQFAESRWTQKGYTPIDSSGTPADVADNLLRRGDPN